MLNYACHRRHIKKIILFLVVWVIIAAILSAHFRRSDRLHLQPQYFQFIETIENSSSSELIVPPSYVINEHFEEIIRKEEENMVPGLGDYGIAVHAIPGINQSEIKASMKKNAFNKILSDKISYTRKLPDARHPLCSLEKYEEDLPDASVVVIFHNEAWSTLIRTVHSIFIRTPSRYLKEILLVDDASDKEELKEKLDYYVQTRFPPEKVKIRRLDGRSGLIRARLAGAEMAVGKVLVFLDSHCECGVGWLEPMLHRIKEKRDAVLTPVIDVINDEDMSYQFDSVGHSFQVGSFSWSGHFTWINIPPREEARRSSPIDYTISPTMAGGLLAINRDYFWEIGSYDDGMDVWGGENLEMSFRIWQCGGTLEISPCSRVGHIFRSFHPYSFPGKKDTHGLNTARMVQVWMDDYKRLFFLHRPELQVAEIGDVNGRKALREKLKCKDFGWYLKNVLPEKFIPDENVQAYGRVKSAKNNVCFDMLQRPEDKPYRIGLYHCNEELSSSQYFSLTLNGELRREDMCAEVESLVDGGGFVLMQECDGAGRRQAWIYKDDLIKNTFTTMCIHMKDVKVNEDVRVGRCDVNDASMKWLWLHRVVTE